MRFVRKIAWVSLVWLTAIMNLIAGTPHFECQCPNGQVKLFCLSGLFGTTKCCCGGSCCSSTGQPEQKSSCCSAEEKTEGGCCSPGEMNSETSGKNAVTVQTNCCSKTWVLPEAQTQAKVKDVTNDALDFWQLALIDGNFAHLLSQSDRMVVRWEEYQIPPPTKLITILQRLTI